MSFHVCSNPSPVFGCSTLLVSPSQERIGIPQQNPFIPSHTRNPATSAKQTPIHARRKLCVSVHQAQLHPRPDRGIHVALGCGRGAAEPHGGAVGPQAHRHVVAGADEDVGGVWAPGEPADGVLVAGHHGQGAIVGHAQVKGPDDAVDAGGGDDARGSVGAAGVFVPVVCQDLGGLRGRQGLLLLGVVGGGRREQAVAGRRGLVDGDVGDEVVLGRGREAQVEEAEARVGGDGGEEGGVARGEGGRVGAGADGEGLEGVGAGWRPLVGGKDEGGGGCACEYLLFGVISST